MKYIWACSCGQETECSREDQQAGAVWHCESCSGTFACVRTKNYGKVWITVNQNDIDFHRILEEIEDEE